jgi:hypothetical protein
MLTKMAKTHRLSRSAYVERLIREEPTVDVHREIKLEKDVAPKTPLTITIRIE